MNLYEKLIAEKNKYINQIKYINENCIIKTDSVFKNPHYIFLGYLKDKRVYLKKSSFKYFKSLNEEFDKDVFDCFDGNKRFSLLKLFCCTLGLMGKDESVSGYLSDSFEYGDFDDLKGVNDIAFTSETSKYIKFFFNFSEDKFYFYINSSVIKNTRDKKFIKYFLENDCELKDINIFNDYIYGFKYSIIKEINGRIRVLDKKLTEKINPVYDCLKDVEIKLEISKEDIIIFEKNNSKTVLRINKKNEILFTKELPIKRIAIIETFIDKKKDLAILDLEKYILHYGKNFEKTMTVNNGFDKIKSGYNALGPSYNFKLIYCQANIDHMAPRNYAFCEFLDEKPQILDYKIKGEMYQVILKDFRIYIVPKDNKLFGFGVSVNKIMKNIKKHPEELEELDDQTAMLINL
jgi:hypothetical protein